LRRRLLLELEIEKQNKTILLSVLKELSDLLEQHKRRKWIIDYGWILPDQNIVILTESVEE